MATFYILHSPLKDLFYIGSCLDFEVRLNEHISPTFKQSYTSRADDWQLYYKYDGLEYKMARLIENQVKSMKSRKYYANLKAYPDIMQKLIAKYK